MPSGRPAARTLTTCRPAYESRVPSTAYCWTRSINVADKRRSARARHPDGRPLAPTTSPTSTAGRCSAASMPRSSRARGPTRCSCSSTSRSTPPEPAPRGTSGPTDGTPVVDVDRGGKITWHGPGQLVGYPIVRLAEPIDVVAHVRRARAPADRRARASTASTGYRVEGRSGVWVRRPLGEDKIAAIGVRVQRGVTMHGFALNCDNSLAGFRGIIPCGITDAGRHDGQRGGRGGCLARATSSTPSPRRSRPSTRAVAA